MCNKTNSHNKIDFACWTVLILSIFEVQQDGATLVSFWSSLMKGGMWHNTSLIEKQRHLRLIVTSKFKLPKQPGEDALTFSLHYFNNLVTQCRKYATICSE